MVALPSMYVLALDPGYEQTAMVLYDPAHRSVGWAKILPNAEVENELRNGRHSFPQPTVACEMIASYGMAVGREVFETCVWIGRFLATWEARGLTAVRIFRRDVKTHLCHSARATDANVRTALLDAFGPGKEKAVGTKKAPGPLYGLKGDLWAALAVAVTWAERVPTDTTAALAANQGRTGG